MRQRRYVYSFAAVARLALGVVCAFSVALEAVPANPSVCTLTQADGSSFTAVLRGDEFYSYYQTLDGRLVLLDDDLGDWFYAEPQADGRLLRTTIKVDAHAETGSFLNEQYAAWQKAVAKEVAQQRLDTAIVKNNVPSAHGTLRGLLLLVNFSDTHPTYGRTDFENLLNQTGYEQHGALGSVNDYFAEVSYGQLDVVFDVYGWIQLPKSRAYYGQEGSGQKDENITALVYEALFRANPMVNYADYDNNQDGYVDLLGIVHQGCGEEEPGIPEDRIWSRFGQLPHTRTHDLVKMQSFFVAPECWGEAMARIGVFCHEIGHAFNLPDLYDGDGSSPGLGDWSVMSHGVWLGPNRQGAKPAHFDAWSKQVLGWVPPRVVLSAEQNLPLKAADSYADALQIPVDAYQDGEYFLVTNRLQRETASPATGFDAYLPGSGALILHVDDYRENNMSDVSPKIAVERAGGFAWTGPDANDLFPAGAAVFGSTTTPGSQDNEGHDTGIVIDNFQDAGAEMLTCNVTPPVQLEGHTVFYDVLGARMLNFGYGDGDDLGCVKFKTEQAGTLERVKTFFGNEGTTYYTVAVYESLGGGMPHGLRTKQSGKQSGRGYQEIVLDRPQWFDAGREFVVEIRFTSKDGYSWPLPISTDGQPSGRSYVRSRHSDQYTRLLSVNGYPYDLLIRANLTSTVP